MPEISLTRASSDIQVSYNGKLLIIDFHYDPRLVSMMHKVEGAIWDKVVPKKWTVPKESHSKLIETFKTQIIWKSPEEWKTEAAALSIKEESLEDVLSRIPHDVTTSYMKIDPYNFQKLAVGWAITPKGLRGKIQGGLLGDLMGLGKTIEGLAIAGKFKEMGNVKRCLIVCPATLKMQWGQEIERFTSESYIIIDGDRNKRAKQYQRARDENITYTIVNYELLRERMTTGVDKKGKRIKGDYLDVSWVNAVGYDMIIVDEAHRMKNPMTLTSMAIREIQPPFRLLMTGTPIEKDLQNIFQLADYLSPNIFSTETYDFEERRKAFEDRFLVMGWNPFALKYGRRVPVVKGVKNVGLLKNTIAPYMLRRTTEDVSDEMPESFENIQVVEWESKHQKKLYEDLQSELMSLAEKQGRAETEEAAIKVENEMNAMLMYMQEVCDAPELLLKSDSLIAKRKCEKFAKKKGKELSFPDPPKLTRLIEMVEDIISSGEKVVIFTKFERMTQIIANRLEELNEEMMKEKEKHEGASGDPFKIVMYTGAVPKGCEWKSKLEKEGLESSNLECNRCPFAGRCQTRTKSAWHFQQDPSTKVIVCTDAANYGVNLQAGRYLFNYDLPDSYSIYAQRNGRIKRLGSNHDTVYIYNLLTQGGIDEKKYYKLLAQKDIIDQVVEKTDVEEEAVIRATSSMERELINEIKKENKKRAK